MMSIAASTKLNVDETKKSAAVNLNRTALSFDNSHNKTREKINFLRMMHLVFWERWQNLFDIGVVLVLKNIFDYSLQIHFLSQKFFAYE